MLFTLMSPAPMPGHPQLDVPHALHHVRVRGLERGGLFPQGHRPRRRRGSRQSAHGAPSPPPRRGSARCQRATHGNV
jgi:hypothetical protein